MPQVRTGRLNTRSTWVVRRKRAQLPRNADERDRARFAKAQSYMVRRETNSPAPTSAAANPSRSPNSSRLRSYTEVAPPLIRWRQTADNLKYSQAARLRRPSTHSLALNLRSVRWRTPCFPRRTQPHPRSGRGARQRRDLGHTFLVIAGQFAVIATVLLLWVGQDLTYSPGWAHPMAYYFGVAVAHHRRLRHRRRDSPPRDAPPRLWFL